MLYVAEALRYPLGSLSRPGAGLYPLLVGGLIGLAALATAAEVHTAGRGSQVTWPDRPGTFRVLSIVAAAVTYIVLLPYTGHLTAAIPVTVVPLWVMGIRRWWQVAGLSVFLTLASYYLFVVLLRVPFPAGILLGG